tara:strand:- start:2794 stop:4410 length:1617 start_codon:yes stop_codon:yes gene_type:complete
MPRSSLPNIKSLSKGSFEPRKNNPIEILEDKPLGDELIPISIGGEISPIEIAKESIRFTSTTKIEGSLEVDGNVVLDNTEVRDLDIKGGQFTIYEDGSTTNYARFLFASSEATLLGASKLNIDAGDDIMFKADGNTITWYGGDGVSNVWELSTDGMTMGGYDTANRGYTFATTGTGDLIFEGDGLVIKDNGDVDTPASGYGTLYVNSDVLYFKTDGGTATNLLSGGGGASALDDLSDVTYSSGDLTISSLDTIVTGTCTWDSSGYIHLDATTYGTTSFKKTGTTFADLLVFGSKSIFDLYSEGDSSTNDYFQITVAEHGESTIITKDTAAAAAHLKFEPDGSFLIKETSSAGADVAGYGQLWIRDSSPNNLYFTDDTGQDVQITNNGSLASSSADTDFYDVRVTNFYTNSVNNQFLPLAGYVIERDNIASQNEFVSMVAPYDGTIERIMFRCETNQNGTLEFDIYESSDTTETPGTVTGTKDMSINIADDISVTVDFSSMTSGTNALTKGRIYAIQIDTPSVPYDTNITIVFKWDSST